MDVTAETKDEEPSFQPEGETIIQVRLRVVGGGRSLRRTVNVSDGPRGVEGRKERLRGFIVFVLGFPIEGL